MDTEKTAIEVKLQAMNRICFTTSIVSIVMGVVLSLAMIWLEMYDNEFVYKSWLSLCVFFFGSLMTMAVGNALGPRVLSDRR